MMMPPVTAVVRVESITLGWATWPAEDIRDYALVRVEWEMDGVPLPGVPPLVPIPPVPFTYTIPQEVLTLGTHRLRGRTVSAVGNGEWVEMDVIITPIAPPLLREVTVTVNSVPVTPPEAVDMAHAYGVLATGKKLTHQQLVAATVGFNGIWTRGNVLAHLDAAYIRATS